MGLKERAVRKYITSKKLLKAFPDVEELRKPIEKEDIKLIAEATLLNVELERGVKDIGVRLVVTNSDILFAEKSFTSNRTWRIPFKWAFFGDMGIQQQRDIERENKMTATTLFACGMPMSSFKFINTIFTLPFKNKDGKKILVSFSTERPRDFIAILRKEVPNDLLEKKLDSQGENKPNKFEGSSLEILKKRYAKGEISEEEFRKKKEVLEE